MKQASTDFSQSMVMGCFAKLGNDEIYIRRERLREGCFGADERQ
ncbi:hypothetical protein [Legionella donaldsonii]|nr:hypothetical protein [Legionella donaldsonii]